MHDIAHLPDLVRHVTPIRTMSYIHNNHENINVFNHPFVYVLQNCTSIAGINISLTVVGSFGIYSCVFLV